MKNKKNVVLITASICLVAGLSIFAFWEPGWSLYSTVSNPFVQCDVGLGFPSSSGAGPIGQVPLLGGQILTSDAADSSLRTYVDYPSPFCTSGYVSPNINSTTNIYGALAQGFDGKIYAISASNNQFLGDAVVEIDKTNGNVIRTLDNSSFLKALGIAVDPMNGDLYISDQNAGKVYKISDPGGCTICTATPFADLTVLAPAVQLAIDGLGWSPDAFSLLVVAAGSDQVILVDRNGTPSVFVNVGPGNVVHPDGIAFGCPGTPLWTPTAQFAFTNNNSGTVAEINMITKGVTTIASGGTRGDFTAVDDQGTLLATQSDRVTRLSTTNGGRFCLAGGGLCSNLQSAAAVATSGNFCVIDPSVKATIKRLVKPICGNLTCNPALAQKQICSLISFVKANAPNCTGLLTAARTLRDQLSTVSPSPCPGT